MEVSNNLDLKKRYWVGSEIMSVSAEREQELRELFYAETNEPETEEWRESLSHEEQKMVDEWDKRVAIGLIALCDDILAAERKRNTPQQSKPTEEHQPKRHNAPMR